MKIRNLIEILKEQNHNLNSLLKIVKEKQNILVNNKLQELKDYISLEENKLLEIQITEEKRLRLMQKLFTEYQIKKERFKLGILIERLKNKISNDSLNSIKEKEASIKSVITKIAKINQQNLLLVQQSSQIISEIVKAVMDTSERSIIDRKG